MYRSNFHTKMIIFNIFNQLKHIPSKALVAQWEHPLSCGWLGRGGRGCGGGMEDRYVWGRGVGKVVKLEVGAGGMGRGGGDQLSQDCSFYSSE